MADSYQLQIYFSLFVFLRYGIINVVKREIVGRIDSSLEEKIDTVINQY